MIFSIDELYHYGTPRHSGRYPWGSGDNPYQHESGFRQQVADMRKQGMSDTEIARTLNMTTSEFRKRVTLEREAQKAADYTFALKLRDKGCSYTEIADRLGYKSPNSVKNLLDPAMKARNEVTSNIADVLKNAVDEKQYIDVGPGTELYLGISRDKLNKAIKKLQEDGGYHVEKIKVKQLGTGENTTISVLVANDKDWKTVNQNRDKIQLINGRFEDDGRSYLNLEPPVSVDSKRIEINYADTGTGAEKDGVIELRRGVDDISLGDANYAQVRIAVDGTHYLKGMAMYADDLPDGIDIRFNTNKDSSKSLQEVLKPLKDDTDNPFGATIKPEEKLILAQRHYIDGNGEERLSAINIVNEEGDWNKWSKSLSSQFLSKQPVNLAKRQLNLDYTRKDIEYNDILELTNPTIKRKLLESFADDCDSRAVHLKAAALPRQQSHVILPLTNIKQNEIYAPNYKTGEEVVLIRYPHGGKFEIPRLTVNNNNQDGKKYIGNDAPDAVGIHYEVAKRLSGADFDGDTVMVIPVNKDIDIKTSSPLKGLKNFEPTEYYKAYPGMPKVSPKTGFDKQMEMGKVSNLITDMTLKGATDDEIARAVRHSMVVIDAEKHNLDWRRSEIDNGIKQLKEKYQDGGGASTIISRASSDKRIPERKEITSVSKMTPEQKERYFSGEKIYENTNRTYVDKNGKIKQATQKSTKMYEASDAYSLVSRNPTAMEKVYADYANQMKALANSARKEARSISDIPYSISAAKTYATERYSLDAKLNAALKQKPLERQAQLIANNTVYTKVKSNPSIKNDKDEMKRLKGQALDSARHKVGKQSYSINITDKEWEAIQAGAVSKTKLKTIIDNADQDRLKELATPKRKSSMTPAKIARAKAMAKRGYNQAEIAEALSVSTTAIADSLK